MESNDKTEMSRKAMVFVAAKKAGQDRYKVAWSIRVDTQLPDGRIRRSKIATYGPVAVNGEYTNVIGDVVAAIMETAEEKGLGVDKAILVSTFIADRDSMQRGVTNSFVGKLTSYFPQTAAEFREVAKKIGFSGDEDGEQELKSAAFLKLGRKRW